MATFKYLLTHVPPRTIEVEAKFYTLEENSNGFAINFFDESDNKVSTVAPGVWVSVWKVENTKPKAESNVEDEVKVPFDFSKLSFTQTDLQKGLKLFNQLYGNKD